MDTTRPLDGSGAPRPRETAPKQVLRPEAAKPVGAERDGGSKTLATVTESVGEAHRLMDVARAEAARVDDQRVAELKAKVEAGEYRVDAPGVVDRLLSDLVGLGLEPAEAPGGGE